MGINNRLFCFETWINLTLERATQHTVKLEAVEQKREGKCFLAQHASAQHFLAAEQNHEIVSSIYTRSNQNKDTFAAAASATHFNSVPTRDRGMPQILFALELWEEREGSKWKFLTLGWVLNFHLSCCKLFSPFLPLHTLQAVTRFCQSHLPPFDFGMTWSIVRLWFVPQYLATTSKLVGNHIEISLQWEQFNKLVFFGWL